jgi:hypothetical protein
VIVQGARRQAAPFLLAIQEKSAKKPMRPLSAPKILV